VSRFFDRIGSAESELDGADRRMGSRHHAQLRKDPAEAVPNGTGADLKLSANLPVGMPLDEELQDLDFALREPNLITGARRWVLPCRACRRLCERFASQQLLHQAFELGFLLQQFAVEVRQQVSTPTVRHAAFLRRHFGS